MDKAHVFQLRAFSSAGSTLLAVSMFTWLCFNCPKCGQQGLVLKFH